MHRHAPTPLLLCLLLAACAPANRPVTGEAKDSTGSPTPARPAERELAAVADQAAPAASESATQDPVTADPMLATPSPAEPQPGASAEPTPSETPAPTEPTTPTDSPTAGTPVPGTPSAPAEPGTGA